MPVITQGISKQKANSNTVDQKKRKSQKLDYVSIQGSISKITIAKENKNIKIQVLTFIRVV